MTGAVWWSVAAFGWTVDPGPAGGPIADRLVPDASPGAFPSVQIAAESAGNLVWVVWEAIDVPDSRTQIRGRRRVGGVWAATSSGLDDEDLDTTDDLEFVEPPSLQPSLTWSDHDYRLSYVRRTRTGCSFGCGLIPYQVGYTGSFAPVFAGVVHGFPLNICQRVGLTQLLDEEADDVRWVPTWTRQELISACLSPDPKPSAWEAQDDLGANWVDDEPPYAPGTLFDLANDPTGVPAAEHHLDAAVGGNDRSIALVYDDWHGVPHMVAFAGFERNPAGPPEYVPAGIKPISNGDPVCPGECEATRGTLDRLFAPEAVVTAWVEHRDGETVILHRRCVGLTPDCADGTASWTPNIGAPAEVVIDDGNPVDRPTIVVVPSKDASGTVFPSIYVIYETVVDGQQLIASSKRTCIGAPTDSLTFAQTVIDPPLPGESQALSITGTGSVDVADAAGVIHVVWTERYLSGGLKRDRIQNASEPFPSC